MQSAAAHITGMGPSGAGFLAKTSLAIGIKISAAGLSFVMFVALARAMEQSEYGVFGLMFSAATLLALVGSVGQRNLVLRFASVYIGQNASPRAFGVIGYGYRTVAMGAGGIAFALGFAGLFTQQYRAELWALAALTLTLAWAEFQPNPQRAAGRVLLALAPRDILCRVLMIGLAGYVIAGFGLPLTAVQICLAMSLVLFTLSLFQALALPFTHPIRLMTETADITDRADWRAASWGLWGNSVLNAAGRNLAMVLVGLLLPAAQTGAFFAALRTAMVLELCLMAVNIVAAPLLARGLAAGATAETQDLCRRISLLVGIPSVIGFLIFAFAGDHVLTLFGADFAQAHPALIILAAGYLFSALSGPTAQIMEMGGQERAYLRMLAVTTFGAMVMLIPLTLWLGMTGAALAIAANMIGLKVWAYWHIHTTTGLSPGLWRLGT